MPRKREPDAPRRYDPDGRPVTSIVSASERISHSQVFGRTNRMFYGRRQDAPLEARFIPAHDHIVSQPRRVRDSHVHEWTVRGVSVTKTQDAKVRTPMIIVAPAIPEPAGFLVEADMRAMNQAWEQRHDALGTEVRPYDPPVGVWSTDSSIWES